MSTPHGEHLRAQSLVMSDDAEIRRANLRRFGQRPAELSAKYGRVVSYWSDLMREGSKKPFGEKVARQIEDQMSLPRGTLDMPPDPASGRRRGKHLRVVSDAEPVLYEITVPPSVPWEWLVSAQEIPRMFVVKMPDGALVGDIAEGDELVFDRECKPEVGRAVLLETSDGKRCIRRFAEGQGSSWRALATSDAYLSFDSSRDELKVLAALRWRR